MSRNHPEKQHFLHSTSDTDSDFDNEQGWADVGLTNQLGRGSYGAPKQNSYVTHDFTVFQAVKLDPDQTEVTGESNVLHNKERKHEQEVEGNLQYSIKDPTPFLQGRSSLSRDRPQESISQSHVSQSNPRGVEPSGRDSHIESAIEKRSSQLSHFENEGLAVLDTNVSIFSELEKWPSLQFPFSGIGLLEGLGGYNNINSSIETVLPSETKKVREEQCGKTSRSSDAELDAERQSSQESTFKEIDLGREEMSGRNSSSENQPPLQSSSMEVETFGGSGAGRISHCIYGNEKWSLPYLDPLGDEGGKSSYAGSGNESQSFFKSPLLDIETAGDLLREDISGRNYSYMNNNTERQSPLQSSVVEMETFGGSGGGRTSHFVYGNEKWSIPNLDPPVDESGKSNSLGIGNESQLFSTSPLLDTERVGDSIREEVSGRNSYINSNSEKQSPLVQFSKVEMETFGGSSGGRISHTIHGKEKWSMACLDPLGDKGGKSTSLGIGNERQSLLKSHVLDTEPLGKIICVRHGHVGSMNEMLPVPKPELVDTDVQREYKDKLGSNMSNDESLEAIKEPLLYELLPSPLKELRLASMAFDKPDLVTASIMDVKVGKNNICVGKDNERRPLGKECLLGEQAQALTDSRRISIVFGGNVRRPSGQELVLDEQSKPLRDMKRGSVISGHQVSCLPSTSDVDRDLESMSERTRGRGSVNQSSKRISRIVSPMYEADSDDQNRERGKYGEPDTPEFTPRQSSFHRRNSIAAQVGERFPPEWALLLLGCLLGLATGLSVVLFNKGVHFIHDMAWAGTPKDGAAWFRLQQLIDIWHRVLLLPVVGGVVVGMMHAVLGILDQIKASRPPQPRHTIDWLAGIKPTIKASQAMVTLGTGCSLGPEGPSVDIGRAWANGLATIMKNNKERRIALVAAGAAAGISAGFNAPVSGMFFAIETVLRPQNAENSPPLTTAMIILASVISSTVSQILLEETPAFTVPTYELRSAAELPLYLLLGGVCGVVSVIFVRMTAYFTELFEFLRDQIGVPPTVTPAIGGLVMGVIALKYPGVLYWGFYNVDEILHSGKSAIAPGAGLVTQLICAKVVATAFSKGSGLVGGVYAPSLFIGAAVGSVYGTIAGKIIGAALPGQDTVAHPQAYALVGMAALLAAVCSVPLTSVLLLFELTKDYHILLPLMGGIGVAIWVAAVAKQTTEKHFATSVPFGGRSFQLLGTDEEGALDQSGHEQLVWRRTGSGTELELCGRDDYEGPNVVSDAELKDNIKVSQAMSKGFVKVQAIATVKETIGQILLKQQRCALVVDENDLLEGIFTFSDLQKEVMRAAESSYKGHRAVVDVDKMLVAAMCSGKGDNQGQDTDLVVCFPDMSLRAVIEIMDSSGFKQLPVVARAGKRWQDEGRHVVGLIDRDAIPRCVRDEASKRIAAILAKDEEDDDGPLLDGH